MIKNRGLLAAVILGLGLLDNRNLNANLMDISKKQFLNLERNSIINNSLSKDLQLQQIQGKYYSTLSPIKKVSSLRNTFETNNFYNDPNEVLIARLMLGEGEGTSDLEKIRIGYTAINRLNDNKKRYGKSLKEVILAPYQYTAFQNRKGLLKKPMRYNAQEFLQCLKLSDNLLKGKYEDPTGGATFYFNPKLVQKIPTWAKYLEKVEFYEKDGKTSPHYYYKENYGL